MVDALCETLGDAVAEVRISAAQALQANTSSYATQRILDRLRDKSAPVREASAVALYRRDDTEVRDALVLTLFDEVPSVGLAAAHTLQHLRDVETRDRLLKVIVSESLRARLAAAVALQGVRDVSTIRKLVDIALFAHVPDTREAAIYALRGCPHPDARAARLRLLKDPSTLVKLRALQSFQGETDNEIVDAVLPLLQDRVARVRAEVALLLAGTASKSLQLDLAEQALCDESSEVRRACCLAIRGTQLRDAREVLVKLLEDDQEPYVREAAALGMGAAHSPLEQQVVSEKLLTDGVSMVREACAEILQHQRTPRTIEALCRAALYDDSMSVRARAVLSLQRVDDAWAQGLVRRLALSPGWVASGDSIRCAALKTLASFAIEGTLEELMKVAEEDRSNEVRIAAFDAAMEGLGKSGLAELLRVWKKADEEMRLALVAHLARSKAERAIALIRAALGSDPSWRVRYEALEALRSLSYPESEMAILKAIQDSNPIISERAAEALRGCTDQAVIAALLANLTSKDQRTRYYSALALRGVKDGAAITSIIELCNAPDSDTRQIAVLALSRSSDWRAKEALAQALRDADRTVRISAQRALQH